MIRIISVGKIKETYLKDAIEEYKKRLSKYTKLEIIEIQDEGIDDIEKAKRLEGERIKKNINPKDYVITLEINGKQIDSKQLAVLLDEKQIVYSNITFIIGGSYGLSEDITSLSNYHLSFSKMTFPHQLFRVLLLEQIYRAFKINNNESYHK
ncbi:MAG: 23S rRNA (pseudouridine(1915)-N(3))-methyltransferase RlmH [Bacilli bacterium]|nr:23S rRNA (pseudouridine(1915)-N(3))-methyltransferase RlmH [Bacilli bacterium]